MPNPVYRRIPQVLCLLVLAMLLTAQEAKRITVFSAQGPFPVGIRDREGGEYVALLDVLERVGVTSSKPDGKKFVVRFGGTDVNFSADKAKVKVRGKTVDLGGPAEIDENTLLVPVRGLAPLLSRLLEQPVELREPGRRLMLVPATSFQSELSANPSRFVLHFSNPVSPNIATEPGRLKLTFNNDPVAAPEATQSFQDKLITGASYAEANGNAVLTVTANAPLMATFTDEGKTITLGAAPQTVAQKAAPAPAQAPPAAPPGAPPVAVRPSIAPAAPPRPKFLVVIDPAHGGDDRGAVLAMGMDEKNVTLVLARRLKSVLEGDGIAVMLLRDGDTNPSEDDRAAAANGARATIFISIHAGSIGQGVRTYTARMSAASAPAGAMVPWDTAQAGFLESSRGLAATIDAQVGRASLEHAASSAQLQPLPHITAAAVSVEFLPNEKGVASLLSPEYQQRICTAVADGIVASRRVLEARK